MLEEREQEKEKSAVHGSKADKVMAEVEELKSKMRSIELEKTSLQTTVSSFCNIIIIFHSCFKESFYWIMHRFFSQFRLKFNVHIKIPVCIECMCMCTVLMSVVP